MALKGIDETLDLMLAAIDDRLVEDGVGAKIVAKTIGDPVIMPGAGCGGDELWGNFLQAHQGNAQNGAQVRNRKPCAPGLWYAQYRITLARCFPMLDARGNVPDPQDRSEAAVELHADAAAIQTALNCYGGLEEPPYVESINVVNDPTGGVSRVIATVRAPVSMARARNPRASA